jgi:hypothetical protein
VARRRVGNHDVEMDNVHADRDADPANEIPLAGREAGAHVLGRTYSFSTARA